MTSPVKTLDEVLPRQRGLQKGTEPEGGAESQLDWSKVKKGLTG